MKQFLLAVLAVCLCAMFSSCKEDNAVPVGGFGDLAYYQSHGNIKSITYFNSEGDPCGTVEFDESGREVLTEIGDSWIDTIPHGAYTSITRHSDLDLYNEREYDDLGRLVFSRLYEGWSSFTYDDLGRIVREEGCGEGETWVTEMEYDADGHIVSQISTCVEPDSGAGSMESTNVTYYTVESVDDHGNWLERSFMVDDVQMKERREIRYY